MNLRDIKANLARYALQDDQLSLRLFSRLLFKPLAREKIRNILVYRIGNIGDTVAAIPALAVLRTALPQARITLLTSAGTPDLPGAKDVLDAFPQLVNQVIHYLPQETKTWEGLQHLKARLLAQGPIDLWASLPITMQTFHRSLQEMLMARWLGCQFATGFSLLLPDFFKTVYARYYKETLPKTSDWLLTMMGEALNYPADPANPSNYLHFFQPPVPWQPHDWDINPQYPMLVVNAGAKLPIKRWPATYFQKTLQQLQLQFPELQLLLLGNEAEKNLNEEIREGLSGTALNLSGQLNLSQTWSLLNQATALLSNDTGAMHMAGLLQKTVFTPMSGQYPAPIWHPPGRPLVEYHRPVPCAPCFETKCPLSEQICMSLLTPELILPGMIQHLSRLIGDHSAHEASHS